MFLLCIYIVNARGIEILHLPLDFFEYSEKHFWCTSKMFLTVMEKVYDILDN